MTPESGVTERPSSTPVRIGDEDAPVVTTGTALGAAVAAVDTALTLLTGEVDPSADEVAAMAGLLDPAGSVARAVPVTDALKTVENGRITGTVDRSTVVVLRLPVLASTSTLRAIASGAGERAFDLIDALADSGPVTVFSRAQT